MELIICPLDKTDFENILSLTFRVIMGSKEMHAKNTIIFKELCFYYIMKD